MKGGGSHGAASDFDDLELSYHTIPPHQWTFQANGVRRWVEKRLRGRVLNACAGKTKLAHDHEIVRNDIDEARDADLHVDVCDIEAHCEPASFGPVVYDPPFSEFQAVETYDFGDGEAVVAGSDAIAKHQFDTLLEPGGRVIQFGFTTSCMPASMGYTRQEVAVWNTLGRGNDWLSVIDEKPGDSDFSPRWFGEHD